MFQKIWERYFAKETLKLLFLILGCFYFLYFLIDYSTRSGSGHHHSTLSFINLVKYYSFELIQKLDILLPFALMISTIRTLTQLNTQNELVAMMAGGISMKRILRPFIIIALISVSLIYINTQFAIPEALKHMRHMQDLHALKKNKTRRKMIVQHVALRDNSTLLFQDFDPSAEKFSDVYWIKSFNEIYHMQSLAPTTHPPTGFFVDYLARDESGKMEKVNSFQVKKFPQIKFNKKMLLDTIIPPEEMSLTKLWQRIPHLEKISSEKEAEFLTTFYQKLAMPWLCLFAVLLPAPYCVKFSRYFPVFFIYGFSIFSLAACFIILNAAVLLGSRQVISPFWAIGAPFFSFMTIAVFKYVKLK